MRAGPELCLQFSNINREYQFSFPSSNLFQNPVALFLLNWKFMDKWENLYWNMGLPTVILVWNWLLTSTTSYKHNIMCKDMAFFGDSSENGGHLRTWFFFSNPFSFYSIYRVEFWSWIKCFTSAKRCYIQINQGQAWYQERVKITVTQD